jgi:hypothetical protein
MSRKNQFFDMFKEKLAKADFDLIINLQNKAVWKKKFKDASEVCFSLSSERESFYGNCDTRITFGHITLNVERDPVDKYDKDHFESTMKSIDSSIEYYSSLESCESYNRRYQEFQNKGTIRDMSERNSKTYRDVHPNKGQSR